MVDRVLRAALLVHALLVAARLRAQSPITDASSAVFATADEARQLLAVRDDFVERTSPFDRAARLKSGDEVSVDEYLAFVGEQTLDWPDDDRAKLEAALAAIRPKLAELAVPLPETVYFVRTTGREEGGAYYTRGAAVVFPAPKLAAAETDELQQILAHELFHVLSRAQPELKEKLYAAIGFVSCGDVALPDSIADRRITNPDAPRNDHCIQLEILGERRWAVPVLYARTPKYDVRVGGEFFNYLQFRLLVVDRDVTGTAKPALIDGQPRLAEPASVGGFYEQIGRNTQYVIHPEEVLADNFALLVRGETAVESPEVLRKLETLLREHVPAAAPGSAKANSGVPSR